MTDVNNTPLTEERSLLVEENIDLIHGYLQRIILKHSNFNKHQTNEIISELEMALCRSARAFDASKGYKFSTYVYRAFGNAYCTYMRKTVERNNRYITMGVYDEIISTEDMWKNNGRIEHIGRIDWLRVTHVLKQLDIPNRDINIVIHYLNNEFSLTATGRRYNLSCERIRQIFYEAMGKFKEFMLLNGLLLEDLFVHTNMFWDEVPDREEQLT